MLVGVDIGTQSLKVAVTDFRLAVQGAASRCYHPLFPGPDRAEQDPLLWERALRPAITDALAAAGATARHVTGLAVCGQLDGCIAVDRQGEPHGPCLTWMDRRAQAELADIDKDRLHAVTGIVADASHLAAKIRWLKRQGNMNSTARYHQPVSYIVERLTGIAVIDHALASTSMLYDLRAHDYDAALLSAFGVTSAELPSLAQSGDCAGKLNAQGAALTGLPAGIPVAVGTGDDFSTPLGAGLVEAGEVSVAFGTGEVVGALFAEPVIDAQCLVETHAYPAGGYFVENPGWLAGGAVTWLKDLLGIESYDAFDAIAAMAPSGSDGVVFLPALTGAMAPEWIAGARGCFYGLTPAHGTSHLARSLLEGCGFAMRDVLTRLKTLGARPSSIRFLAGGSRSRLSAQLRADISGLPVFLPQHSDSSIIGAAMLAGVAAGTFANIKDAASHLAAPVRCLTPDAGAAATLDRSYQRYRQLFAAIKSLVPQPSHAHVDNR
ncbi:xylulokinase [Taklimakanibacter deserti]|uniref:xylulokinase n=1 Tax=Taklimakanibacter deserti TaxID=2267839 RepID=UPI000E64E3BC